MSLSRADRLDADRLRRLHRDCIDDPERIRAMLARLEREEIELLGGLDLDAERMVGHLADVDEDRFVLDTDAFVSPGGAQAFLGFELDGTEWFFAADPAPPPDAQDTGTRRAAFAIPSSLYAAERRGFERRPPRDDRDPTRVELRAPGAASLAGQVVDWSYDGLRVEIPREAAAGLASEVTVRFLDGDAAGSDAYGEIRHNEIRPPGADAAPGAGDPAGGAGGWVRLGLAVSRARAGAPIAVERRDRILVESGANRLRKRATTAGAAARMAWRRIVGPRRGRSRVEVPLTRYENARGEEIAAIVDIVGDPHGAPAVVIPPAWGRTKETLLPLAATLVATFERAGCPVVILRYDGIGKRGESYLEPVCRAPGREYERFRFSQCVEDIRTTLDHLEQTYDCRRVVLVSFSHTAIEARRVTATDNRVRGWVSVVGAPDLQNALRIVSGGIDFPYGHQRGVRFGIQEMLGVTLDMDLATEDGLAHNLWFLEDGRRDMMNVHVPVVWLHGRYDAWMDLDRVRDILSCGDTSGRRLIEIPIGHQMRTSKVALESFQLIATETLRMLTGREVGPTLPDLAALDGRRKAERARVRTGAPDLHAFWEDYLLGRGRDFGFDLIASMSSYDQLMSTQIERLEIAPSDRIADLGAGTGVLAAHLGRLAHVPAIDITALDFVSQGLERARERATSVVDAGGALHPVRCDLSLRRTGAAVPLASGAFDAALASLLVSYLDDPARLLAEAWRILKPGGRLVVSSLRRDADTSKLYVEGLEELRAGRAADRLGPHAAQQFDLAMRSFMNDAARLLELEENETFRFYDSEELAALVEAAGFREVRVDEAFGAPPQAVVVSARK